MLPHTIILPEKLVVAIENDQAVSRLYQAANHL